MTATIRDIKKQTGLSLATISKYINGGNVLPENRIKIEKAIKDLNYQVNEIARGLVTNKTRTVGVVVYSVEDMFNGTLLHHIGNALRKEKYALIICDSCNDEKIEAENIKFLINKKVDGIIIVPIARRSEFLEPAFKADVPVVLLDRPLNDIQLDCVGINNRLSAKLAVEKLIENNHRKIAIICANLNHEYTGFERYKGYLDALEDAKIPVNREYIRMGLHSIEFGQKSMMELLALKDRPTAVFMSNNDLCLGALIALNESELSCPENISMIGFDELIISHVIKPQLCVVAQPMKEMSDKAVEILMSHIHKKGNQIPVNIILSTKIREGDSILRI